jgi:putative transposase
MPAFTRVDNGPGFVSLAIPKRLTSTKVETVRVGPGKPWQNGAHGRFNGRLRDECPNVEWFRTRGETRIVIEAWRPRYSAVRPDGCRTSGADWMSTPLPAAETREYRPHDGLGQRDSLRQRRS